MNKLTIPVILVATVMIAGAFAFMPVEQASTVHTTANLITTTIGADDAVGTGGTFDIIADSAVIKSGVLCIEVTQETTDGNNEALTVEISTDGAETVILIADLDVAAGACFDLTGYRVFIDNSVEASTIFSYTGSFTTATP